MPINPDKRPGLAKPAPTNDKIAGVPLDGSRFADTAFDDPTLDDESNFAIANPDTTTAIDYSTMQPHEEAWHRLDQLKNTLDAKYKMLVNEHQSILNDEANSERDREVALGIVKRLLIKAQELYEKHSYLDSEKKRLTRNIEDIKTRRNQVKELSSQVKRGTEDGLTNLLPQIRALHETSFQQHNLSDIEEFSQSEQQFFLQGDIKSYDALQERSERSLYDPEYSNSLLDYAENEALQETDTDIPAIVEKFWKLEVGSPIEPPYEVKVNGRTFLLTTKIGQGGFGIVLDGTRYPTPEEKSAGKEPMEVVIKMSKVFNNNEVYSTNGGENTKNIYREIAALDAVGRKPFTNENGSVTYPDNLDSIPVSVMLDSAMLKVTSPEQKAAQEQMEAEIAPIVAELNATLAELSAPLEEKKSIIAEITNLNKGLKVAAEEDKSLLADQLSKAQAELVRWYEKHGEAQKKVNSLQRQINFAKREVALKTGDDRALFLTQEKITGPELSEVLERGISFETGMDYAYQILNAIHYAHSGGVMHSDLKPGNIMVTKTGKIKLVDFGISYIDGEITSGNSGDNVLTAEDKKIAEEVVAEEETRIPSDTSRSASFAEEPQYLKRDVGVAGTLSYMPPFLKSWTTLMVIQGEINRIHERNNDNPELATQEENAYWMKIKTSLDYYSAGEILSIIAKNIGGNYQKLDPQQKKEIQVLNYVSNRLISENATKPLSVDDIIQGEEEQDRLHVLDAATMIKERNLLTYQLESESQEAHSFRAKANEVKRNSNRLTSAILRGKVADEFEVEGKENSDESKDIPLKNPPRESSPERNQPQSEAPPITVNASEPPDEKSEDIEEIDLGDPEYIDDKKTLDLLLESMQSNNDPFDDSSSSRLENYIPIAPDINPQEDDDNNQPGI
ncbi:MAG: protein kinase [bacterium]|nr:protein kinase [bacterium]